MLLRLQCILHSSCLFSRIAQCQRRCGVRYATSCLRTWQRGAFGCDISSSALCLSEDPAPVYMLICCCYVADVVDAVNAHVTVLYEDKGQSKVHGLKVSRHKSQLRAWQCCRRNLLHVVKVCVVTVSSYQLIQTDGNRGIVTAQNNYQYPQTVHRARSS